MQHIYFIFIHQLVVHPPSYGARLLLSVALDPCDCGPLVLNLLMQLASYLQLRMDGTRSTSRRTRTGLANLSVTIQRV